MEAARPQYHAYCFDKALAAQNGYGAFVPNASLILGIVALGAGAWFIDPHMTLGSVLCVAGFGLLILSLITHGRRRRAQLTAFAQGPEGKLYRVKRSGYRGIGLFAAGDAAGELADTLLGTTAGSDIGSLAGGIAGMAAVQKLIKAMGTPSVINAMLSNPDAVRGAELTTIDKITYWNESPTSYLIHCAGRNIKSGKNFSNKRIRIAKAYTEPEQLHRALGALE